MEVVSILVTFAEFSPSNSFSGVPATDDNLAMHCGEPMELVIPAVGPQAVESFESEEDTAVHLPPVWRCNCGFQLDAVAGSIAPAALRESASPYESALCA